MLNSNYLSKRAFTLTIKVFHLWLEQQYNISCTNDVVFSQQIHFYNSYIKYLNYREKYIQDRKKGTAKKMQEENKLLYSIKNELLNNLEIITYHEYIKR